MILDHLFSSAPYENAHPLFAAAFAHLRKLAAGRIELDGERIFVKVAV